MARAPGRRPARATTRRLSLPRTSPKGLDRSDREIDVGYCCVTALRSIVLIGQSDFSGAGRSNDRRNGLACNALVVGAHSHHSDEVHFEREIFHGGSLLAGRPLPLVTRGRASVHLPGHWGTEAEYGIRRPSN